MKPPDLRGIALVSAGLAIAAAGVAAMFPKAGEEAVAVAFAVALGLGLR